MERVLTRASTRPEPFEPTNALLMLVHRIAVWRQRVRTRHQLAMLDARGLADIGISPGERDAELSKPFWR